MNSALTFHRLATILITIFKQKNPYSFTIAKEIRIEVIAKLIRLCLKTENYLTTIRLVTLKPSVVIVYKNKPEDKSFALISNCC